MVVSATVSFTVKVATPLALVIAFNTVIVELFPRLVTVELPPFLVNVTVFPLTGLLLASFKVTVMVEVVVPSATTEDELAATVEVEAETAPAVNVTVAVAVIVTESVVSVAV